MRACHIPCWVHRQKVVIVLDNAPYQKRRQHLKFPASLLSACLLVFYLFLFSFCFPYTLPSRFYFITFYLMLSHWYVLDEINSIRTNTTPIIYIYYPRSCECVYLIPYSACLLFAPSSFFFIQSLRHRWHHHLFKMLCYFFHFHVDKENFCRAKVVGMSIHLLANNFNVMLRSTIISTERFG